MAPLPAPEKRLQHVVEDLAVGVVERARLSEHPGKRLVGIRRLDILINQIPDRDSEVIGKAGHQPHGGVVRPAFLKLPDMGLRHHNGTRNEAVEPLFEDVNKRQKVVDQAAELAVRWPDMAPTAKRQVLKCLVNRINLMSKTLEIRIAPGQLLELFWDEDTQRTLEPTLRGSELSVTLTVPAHLKRAGMETRLLITGEDGSARKSPDRSMLRLLSQAQRFHHMVMHSRGRTMAELAIEAGVGGSYFTRILRLSFLAPDVVKTILQDHHPIELTAKKLAGDTRLPLRLQDQRVRLGIG